MSIQIEQLEIKNIKACLSGYSAKGRSIKKFLEEEENEKYAWI